MKLQGERGPAEKVGAPVGWPVSTWDTSDAIRVVCSLVLPSGETVNSCTNAAPNRELLVILEVLL